MKPWQFAFFGHRSGISVPVTTTLSAAEPEARLWWVTIAAAAFLVTAPLWLTDVPPLLDYPSHLARMAILSASPADSVRQIWTPSWSPIPNLAMDVVVLGLALVLPLHLAGKLFITVALLLPPLGAIALHRALFRRRSWWPLASFAMSYNGILLAGFLNFLVGTGLALLAAAVWVHWFDRNLLQRTAAVVLFSILVFFSHLTALIFMAGIQFFIELSMALRQRRVVLARFIVVAITLLPLLFLSIAKPMVETASDDGILSGVSALMTNPFERLRNLLTPFLTYDPVLDLAMLVIVLVAIAVARRAGRLAVAPGPSWLALTCLVVFPVFPTAILGATWVDRRLPVFAMLLLIAAVDPMASRVRWCRWLLMTTLALTVARIGFIANVWAEWEATDRADLQAVAAKVEPLTRVLVVRAADRGHPRLIWDLPRARQIMVDVDATIHWPALPLVERPAFFPLLHTSLQPIVVQPAYACLARIQGQPPSWRAVLGATDADLRAAPYLTDWAQRFDYMLVLQAGRIPDADHLLPGQLTPVVVKNAAALYRIKRPDGGSGWAPACPDR